MSGTKWETGQAPHPSTQLVLIVLYLAFRINLVNDSKRDITTADKNLTRDRRVCLKIEIVVK